MKVLTPVINDSQSPAAMSFFTYGPRPNMSTGTKRLSVAHKSGSVVARVERSEGHKDKEKVSSFIHSIRDRNAQKIKSWDRQEGG